jgi:hypothetical protein
MDKKFTSGRVDFAIKFFHEKYFTIYFPPRTERFSHMTARPVDPENRRRPLRIAAALVLAMVAVLLAAGCVSQGSDNQTQTLTTEKYVFLEHRIDESIVTVSGTCHRFNPSYYCGTTYNMSNSVLTIYPDASRNARVNKTLILFYGQQHHVGGTGGFDCGNDGWFVYSLPGPVSENITIDSLADDGTVAFRFMDSPVILKPYERWENISSVRYHQDKITFENGEFFPECTEDYVKVHSIYNAGLMDKKTIILPVPERTPEPAFKISAKMFMNWTASRGEP